MFVLVTINIVVSGVAVLCLYMTYFWPLVIKSLEGASALSSLGANLLRKCERVFFDKKDSHGVRVLGLGLQTQEPYWEGSTVYVREI